MIIVKQFYQKIILILVMSICTLMAQQIRNLTDSKKCNDMYQVEQGKKQQESISMNAQARSPKSEKVLG